MDVCVKQVAIFIFFASVVLWQGMAFGANAITNDTDAVIGNPSTNANNSSTASPSTASSYNMSHSSTVRSPYNNPEGNTNGLLQRSLYVAIGISSIVAIYFVVRAVKTRGRRKAKKYGVIHGTGSMELQPLDKDVDEEEEDMTLFDRKESKWPR